MNQNNNYNFDPMTGQPIQQPIQNQNTTNMYSQPVQSTSTVNAYQQRIQLGPPKKNNKAFLIVAILAVAGIVTGIFLFFNQDKKDPINNENSNNPEVENNNTNNGFDDVIDDEYTDSKQEVAIVAIGHEDHGKSTLTSAITKLYGDFVSYEDIVAADEYKYVGVKYKLSEVKYETENRIYTHYDLSSHEDYVKSIVSGAIEVDGAILVVSVTDGPMAQTREQLKLLYESGVPKVVVYLNKCDMVSDEDLIDLVEMQTRELLSEYGFDGDNTPIVCGSALKSLEGDVDGEQSVRNLVKEVDEWIEPVNGENEDFLMGIEDVFTISGRGTVVTGRVDRGTVKVGDTVQIVGLNDEVKTAIVSGIEMFRKQEDYAVTGDNAGILLKDITREEVVRGQVLAKPNSILASTKFEMSVYVLSTEESDKSVSFVDSYTAQFYFRTTDITGVIDLPDNIEIVNPGETVSFTVSLESPVAMELGTSVSIRVNDSTIAIGRVTNVY